MGHPAAIAERACVGPSAEAKTSTVVPRSAAYYSLDGLATLILVAGILIAIAVQRPSAKTPRNPADLLSYDRALADVRQVAALPHPTGSTANQAVASYIIQQLDAMGVQHRIQDGLSVERGDSNRFRAVHLQNLIATVPGSQSTGSILLMAHYDSVPTSSGAADDASGVAALLETLRVVLRMGPLRNDLVVLFTDGEELGLLGSRVFLRDDPVARSVRIVVNFEARGSGGPSVMFESGDSSDWLVRDFAHWSPHPYTNSLTSAIYKLLPNDTDFTPFRSRGTPGLNLAFIDDPANYHSALDTADRLSSASLEQQLENAQTLALQLGIMDMGSHAPERDVYFNAVGSFLLFYPTSWSVFLSAFAALSFALLCGFGIRRKVLSLRGILAGSGILLLTIIVATLLGREYCDFIFHYLKRGEAVMCRSQLYPLSLTLLAVSTGLITVMWLGKKVGAENMVAGGLVPWLALLGATVLYLPGGNYLILWPFCDGVLILAVMLQVRSRDGISWLRTIMLSVMPLVAFLIVVPVIQSLFVALMGSGAYLVCVLIAFSIVFVIPLLVPSPQHRPWWLAAVSGSAAMVTIAAVFLGMTADNDHPYSDRMLLIVDPASHKSVWATDNRPLDAWSAKLFAESPQERPLGDFLPQWYLSDFPWPPELPTGAARLEGSPADLDAPRELAYQVREKREFLLPSFVGELAVHVETETPIVRATLDGKNLDKTAPIWGHNLAEGIPDDSAPVRELTLYSIAQPRWTPLLEVETAKPGPLRIELVGRSYWLPENAGIAKRPASTIPIRSFGDSYLVVRSFTF